MREAGDVPIMPRPDAPPACLAAQRAAVGCSRDGPPPAVAVSWLRVPTRGARNDPHMTIDYAKARRHLARRDPKLKQLMAAIGPCTLRYEPDGFAALARSIVSQQISTRAAASIHARLLQTVGPAG